jgi:hypothetical protein
VAAHVGTKTGRTVGVFSLQISKEQLFIRMPASEAHIDSHGCARVFVESDWKLRTRWHAQRRRSTSTMRPNGRDAGQIQAALAEHGLICNRRLHQPVQAADASRTALELSISRSGPGQGSTCR